MLMSIVLAAASAGADMYSCTTADGRRISRDRRIEECANVSQVVRRANGAIERIPSEQEQARIDAAIIKAEESRQKHVRESMARRILLTRFPREAAHAKHRSEDLAPVRAAILATEARLASLEVDRLAIEIELQFYPPGYPAPVALLRRAGGNEASRRGAKDNLKNHQDELIRNTKRLDDELATLRELWGGSARTAARE